MKHPHTLLLSLLFLLAIPAGSLSAQQISAHKGTVKNSYNFWIYTPADYDSTRADKPVLLFLHGASLRGSNMELSLRYGPIDALRRGCKIDAVIINPQCPSRERWNPEKIIRMVDWVQQHYAVDTNRLYVIGMSLGGYGTLDFAGAYPQRVAAAIAMCGGSQQKEYCGLNELPLWILHGTADRAVPISQSEKVISGMKACGPADRLLFTRLKGQNHGALARIFYLKEPYAWLFEHRLTDSARVANRSYTIQVDDMHNAYQGLTRQNIPVKKSLAGKEASSSRGTQASDANLVAELEQEMTPEGGGKAAAKSSSKNASKATAKVADAHGKKYHTIKNGDTLGAIARKYHTSVKAICKLNGMKETSTLRIDRKIRVK